MIRHRVAMTRRRRRGPFVLDIARERALAAPVEMPGVFPGCWDTERRGNAVGIALPNARLVTSAPSSPAGVPPRGDKGFHSSIGSRERERAARVLRPLRLYGCTSPPGWPVEHGSVTRCAHPVKARDMQWLPQA